MTNLTELSLKHRALVWYFIIMTAIGGLVAYFQLGRMEDPQFTIRQMVITAAWPGATAEEMQEQVTDKLEKRLQDTPGLDYINSETREGQTVIYVNLKDTVAKDQIRPTWRDVRNFCEDVKKDLPEGVYGPYYNDRFDDVYGSIYAVTGDGYNYEEMREYAEKTRRMLLNVPSVQKVELIGVQPEKVYVEIQKDKLAELGISPQVIANSLKTQNEMTASGEVETESNNVYLRVSGMFQDVEAIREMPINANGKVFRLGDIATVERRFVDPAKPKMFYNGEPAIGIAVSMENGGNILQLGEDLKAKIGEIQQEVPVGIEVHQVSDQPKVVNQSIHDFVKTLVEAIVIVLAVSFLSLGVRTGMVVAGCIPLVLCAVFLIMYALNIDLHKVSLGALIIALGLLVDDAIIAVEMMSVKLEMGLNRFEAACYAFRATAKPMLTGTLITCSGFIPVAFSKGMASEFCQALFPVIGAALLISWLVSVMVAPLFGYHLIRVEVKKDEDGKIDPYQSKFYTMFRQVLVWFLEHRKLVLGATAALFVVSVGMMKFIKQEFFPTSTRPEILIEMKLPEGSSMAASQEVCDRMSSWLQDRQKLLSNYSYYVGRYAPRFVLTVNPKAETDNAAQFVIVAKDTKSREKLTEELNQAFNDEFSDVRAKIQFIQTGPPADYPVMLRVTGYTTEQTKELAEQVADIVAKDPNNYNVNTSWGDKSKVMHLELDQDKLRSLGVSSQSVSQQIYTAVTGAKAAEFYKGDRTIDIDLRLADENRKDLAQMKSLPIYLGQAGYVPLEQIAKISYDAEDGFIERRNLMPTITVQADVHDGTANDATKKAYEATAQLRKDLPFGCSIEPAGALEDSNKSVGFLLQPVPVMIFIIMTLLMFQLGSAKQMILTVLTAPLGLIGVSWGMLLTGSAMGFVAELGILALFGMIIRNSVILIDQIQKHLADGETPWDAVVDSAILRFRPIMLTAAAAILGMLPLMASTFWGPMAVAIASGLLVATVLTLLVLPTMYAVAYKVPKR
ncbi:MAG: efflux RND transporter permease subunit [Selenomonas sp.]|uniref:efflux RND transporter permease subunit n=1 Tax=Selenomonas sp. TaxID=2053611 RepID=UPI0025EF650B|nr:efflux RND transporter permease subunit [Selenomonas sp.]MCR5440050.1 efflux RND transporter permease subunit [Selenomonas sp.]